MISDPKFTDEDHEIFRNIADNIKNDHKEYLEAGEELDKYFDEKYYWDFIHGQLKVWQTASRPDLPKKLLKNPDSPETKEAIKLNKNYYEKFLKENKTPNLNSRLQIAWTELEAAYVTAERLSEIQSRMALLLVWLLTYPEANKSKYGITNFENWPWGVEPGCFYLDDYRGGLAKSWWAVPDRPWGAPENRYPDLWRKIIKHAWANIIVSQTFDVDHMKHSADFSSVYWYGKEYTFTQTQRAAVKLLWQAMENRTPDLGQQHILVEIESDSKELKSIFKKNPAWNTMIISKAKGSYRLAKPQNM